MREEDNDNTTTKNRILKSKNNIISIYIVLSYIAFNLLTYLYLRFLTIVKNGLNIEYTVKYMHSINLVHAIYFLLLGFLMILISKLQHARKKNNLLITLLIWLQPILMGCILIIYFYMNFELPGVIKMNMTLVYNIGFILLGVNIAKYIKISKS